MADRRRRTIQVAQPKLDGNEAAYVAECITEEWITHAGKYVGMFERGFAEWIGTEHAIACSSGTAALHLALLALGVKAGDEVLMPALTYVSAPNAVRYCDATPVFCDSERDTMAIDPGDIEKRITPQTVGIVPVHLYGHPAAMDAVGEIARRHGLWVLEDAAEAHGATYRDKMCGAIGDAGTFSFFGNKIITTGEGGMVTTNDSELAERVRRYGGQGVDPNRRYWFPVVGYNYRMTNIQAALGVAQLEQRTELVQARQDVAGWYRQHLQPLLAKLVLPGARPDVHHAYWMYTVVLADDARLRRDELIERLAEDGIEPRPVFYPAHLLPPYHAPGTDQYPVAERLARQGITLPTHARLTEDDVAYVAERLTAYLN